MKKNLNFTELNFLRNGGEMGQLIRNTDWSKTPIGSPDAWPQNLLITLSMILSSKFPMFLWWGEDLIQFYNDAYCKSLGNNGKHPSALSQMAKDCWPEIWDVIFPSINKVMTTGEATWFEDQLIPIYRNGKIEDVYWTYSYSPIFDNFGNVDGVLVVCNETTDKVYAVKSIKESERRFREIFNQLPLVVWTASTDGKLTHISNQWEEQYGNSIAESLGTGWVNFVHPEDVREAERLWNNSLETGSNYETEFRVLDKKRDYRWMLVRANPIYNEQGIIVSWTGSNTDIHDKKVAEKALEESESRFRTMADNIPNLAWMANTDGHIFWYNKQWYEYSGTTTEQMESWGWQSVHHPDEFPRVAEKWQESIMSGNLFEMVFPLKAADGNYRQFLTRVIPVYNSEGKIYQWFGTNTDITKQVEIEKSLKESELLVRGVVEGAPFFIGVLTGEDFRIRLANPAIMDAWGKGTDVLGKSFKSLLPELEGQDVFKRIDKVYNTGIPFHIENERLDIVIDEKWQSYFYNYSVTPLFDISGNINGVVTYGANVTELNRVKLQIEEAEEKARLAITSAELGVYEIIYDTDEMITDKRFKQIWGIDENATSTQYSEAIHPEDLILRMKAHDESLKSGLLFFQVRIIWKDQSVHWVRATGKVIFDDEGNPLKTIGIVQDVTESVVSQNKIQESEKVLRNIILQAPVAMCILRGPDHIVEIANNKILELMGKEKNEVMFKPLFNILPEAGEQGLEDIMHKVYNTGERFTVNEMPVDLHRNGKIETVYVNFVYEAIMRGEGLNSGVLAVALDVTPQVIARLKIEETVAHRTKDLADANNNLQKSNAELAQFAYIASHDLQEPLRKIATFANMLETKMQGQLDEKSKEYLFKINSSTQRMNNLITDILSYSQLVKNNETFKKVNLNEILENVINDYDLLIEQKQASITHDALPTIDAIPLQMSQLFYNLIGNALKFVKKDKKPVITITVEKMDRQSAIPEKNAPSYKIQFTDNGIGILPEYTNQIFNIFQRLHGKLDFNGTGIGLAMCKKIALNHNGDINANGSTLNGAVFTVILPAKQN